MFLSRGKALDYAVETVFMRAKDRGVEVLDQEEFKNRMTGAEVRDRLGCGEEMRLILGRDCTGEPMEYVSVCVCETEVDSGTGTGTPTVASTGRSHTMSVLTTS